MKRIALIGIAGFLLMLCGCGKYKDKNFTETPTSGSTVLACDRSFEKIMEQEIEVFEYSYPYASILPLYMSESDCIYELLHGKASMAVTTRELTKKEIKLLQDKKKKVSQSCIAVDAIAMIVNKDNPTKELTVAQLQMIMSGEITDWSQIDPENKCGKIQVVFDENGSSTISCVKQKVMDGIPFGDNVFAQGSNEAVFEYVSKSNGSIGVIGVSWINQDMKHVELSQEYVKSLETDEGEAPEQFFNDHIKVLAVAGGNYLDAYKPYQAYIYDGRYPLVRKVFLISKGGQGSLASGFFSFVTGFAGQKLLRSTGVLPGGVHPRVMEIQ